jgi:hypothetical protein
MVNVPFTIVFPTHPFFELFFLDPVAKFFKMQPELKYFVFYQPIHIVYNIAAGLFGQLKTYSWKGRKVK